LLLQPIDLGWSQIDQVIGDVLAELGLGFGDWLDQIAEFGVELGAFVFESVVFFFKLRKIVIFFVAIREFHGPRLLFVFLKIFFAAGFSGGAVFRFDMVSQVVYIGALVGKHALHGKNLRAEVGDFGLEFPLMGLRFLLCLIGSGGKLRVLGIALDRFQVFVGLGGGGVQKRRVAFFPGVLESLPWPLTVRLVPKRPEQARHEDDHRDHVVKRVRLGYDRVLLGDGL